MENKKIIKIILISLLVTGLLYFIAHIYSPGVDVYGQDYRIDNISSFKEIQDKIDSIKTEYPQYRAYASDGKKQTMELVWQETQSKDYVVFFCLKKEKATVLCYIRKDAEEPLENVRITLLRLSKSRNISWKDINSKALSKEENEKVKDLFEQEILNKLGKWRKE
ncbi:hypothetical protein [Dysgonomonas sp. GY617]|uniref:hypothetical protein n=1 Tax=Dysgonomonas sp. GY617 TaxID=2780420 RepID=UPI0018836C57|nr:hypothetical protein [Dysgonomonas sp. GY617]MBF0575441.1 hypothetical protein [Dysgonomonas sp. GY617]